jgi:spoIIIJ-associated protein
VSQGENAVAEPRSDAAARPDAPEPAADETAMAGLAQDASDVGNPADLNDPADLDDPADIDDSADLDDPADLDDSAEIDDADAGDDDADDDDEDEDDGDSEDGGEDEGADDSADGQNVRGTGSAEPNLADLELEGEIAADYIEGLLDVADLDGDIDMDVEGDRAMVSVVGATLDELVGTRGQVLEALQELTRLAVHRQTGGRTRIMLDVGGYRLRRRAELAKTGQEAAEEVKLSGTPKKLWAMNPFERKIVHDAVAAAGLQSESEGEEPDRRVVVLPAS